MRDKGGVEEEGRCGRGGIWGDGYTENCEVGRGGGGERGGGGGEQHQQQSLPGVGDADAWEGQPRAGGRQTLDKPLKVGRQRKL